MAKGPENEGERLTVGQVAERTGLSVRTLHHYDELGLLLPTNRTEAGYRLYGDGAIGRLHRILALQELGLSLEEVAGILDGDPVKAAGFLAGRAAELGEDVVRRRRRLERLERMLRLLDQDEDVRAERLLEELEEAPQEPETPAPEPLSPIREAVTVAIPPDDAFRAFTEGMERWWPAAFTWAGSALDHMGIEAVEDGACFERSRGGSRLDWGRVLAVHPPERLAFSWQINFDRTPQPDPAKASEVEVRFRPVEDGARCRVEVEHRGFERHGASAANYREALASSGGWRLILEAFARSLDPHAHPVRPRGY